MTLIDSNPINQIALKILLKSSQPYFDRGDSEIWVLYIEKSVPEKYIKSLNQSGINTWCHSLQNISDPYYAKFLLKYFVIEKHQYFKCLTYIDPDHIFTDHWEYIYKDNSICVSSESSSIQPEEAIKPYLEKNLPDNGKSFEHYNTSFISAQTKVWREIANIWEEVYDDIMQYVPVRYREEIAFTLAANIKNIGIYKLSSLVQSNFKAFNKDCCIFHYGGEYAFAKKIKNLIVSGIPTYKKLEEVSDLCTDGPENWLIEKMIDILYKENALNDQAFRLNTRRQQEMGK